MPPLCRETQSLGQQMLNAPVGINGLTNYFSGCTSTQPENDPFIRKCTAENDTNGRMNFSNAVPVEDMQVFPPALSHGEIFRNFIKSNLNQIVFTIFRLNQMDVCLVQSENYECNLISVWFNKIPKRFLCVHLGQKRSGEVLFTSLEWQKPFADF